MVVADGTSGEGEGLTIGVPTGSARSRPDGMGTVGAGEAAGTGVVKTARGANQQQPAQHQQQRLFVGVSEWRCNPNVARQSGVPGH